jgi:hypothetical protein
MMIRRTGFTFLSAMAVIAAIVQAGYGQSQPTVAAPPLRQAHAHNDYLHARPLLDALDHGFCSVEADIFLTPEGLLVAHEAKELKPGRTLQSLYLDPLRQRVQNCGGRVYPSGPTFYLLVDVKTEAAATYAALDKLLAGYADILSVTENGRLTEKAVTIILSGNRAIDEITKQSKRYVAIDGRLDDLKTNPAPELVPWISANWTLLFRWRGEGEIPGDEKQKLEAIVRQAHEQKRKVRFWATPEHKTLWQELVQARVDFINTDKLDELQQFLKSP